MLNTRRSLDSYLISLYHAINDEINARDLKGDNVNMATHNYLISARNEVIKLMVLQLQQSSENSPYSDIVKEYMKDNQYLTSAPNDRRIIKEYQTQLQEEKPLGEAMDQAFQKGLAALLRNLQRNQDTQQNIKYTRILNQVLSKYDDYKPDQTDEEKFFDDLVPELRNQLEMHGKVIKDSDLAARAASPYTRLGEQLINEIIGINAEAGQGKLPKIYFALQIALLQLPQFSVKGAHFNDLGLKTFIENKIRAIEKMDPSVITQCEKLYGVSFQWSEYQVKINTSLDKLDVIGRDLWYDHPQESKTIEAIAGEMRQLTENYFKLSPNERMDKYEAYKNNMDQAATKGIKSELFKNYSNVSIALVNILVVVLSLGSALIWLKHTERARGSFWLFDNPPARNLESIKEAARLPEQIAAKEDPGKSPKR